jgi:hypothetical protein
MIAGILLYASVQAGTSTFKDWLWGTETDYYYAATINDAGHLLGQYCYFKSTSCVYFVGISLTCELGSQYPSLLNSDAGAAHISLVCSHKYRN